VVENYGGCQDTLSFLCLQFSHYSLSGIAVGLRTGRQNTRKQIISKPCRT